MLETPPFAFGVYFVTPYIRSRGHPKFHLALSNQKQSFCRAYRLQKQIQGGSPGPNIG